MLPSILAATLCVVTASARPSQLDGIPGLLASLGPAPVDDPRFTTWTAPGPNDVRSPCPGLNTLANHGFIHHDGRNMSVPHLLTGLAAGMNMGADFTILLGAAGLLSSPNPLSGAFDLNDLDQHNFPIEHDASLSRADAYFGDNHSFNATIWHQTLSYYPDSNTTTLLHAAQSLAGRTADSQRINPTFTYGFREFVLRYGETSLYLQTMGSDDTTGVARLDWIRSLFEAERLPYALGWRPRAEPITLPSLGVMVFDLFEISPAQGSEGRKVFSDSYKNVFEGIVGGSEVLNNITNGLAAAVGL